VSTADCILARNFGTIRIASCKMKSSEMSPIPENECSFGSYFTGQRLVWGVVGRVFRALRFV
jgi:hypothetical protein